MQMGDGKGLVGTMWVTKFQNKNSGGKTSTSVPFFSKKEAEEQAFMHIMIGDKAWIEKVNKHE